MYLFFNGLTSLYVVSALFGLFQGGLVPSYAIIVRETMPAKEAATRVGIVIMASVVGMSFGGWVSGVIFDVTGSYRGRISQRHGMERAEYRDRIDVCCCAPAAASPLPETRGGRLNNALLTRACFLLQPFALLGHEIEKGRRSPCSASRFQELSHQLPTNGP